MTCVDGSVLTLVPVPVTDRTGTAYEVTLRLLLGGEPFGDVGECCGWRLARTADQLRALQELEPGDRADAFPPGAYDAVLDEGLVGDGDRAVLRRLLPRDRELLCLRARDPDDGDPSGELRLWVREDRTWHEGRGEERGRWSLRTRAVLDAWGSGGTGVRALLDGRSLLALLDALLDQVALARDQGRLQAGGLPAEGAV